MSKKRTSQTNITLTSDELMQLHATELDTGSLNYDMNVLTTAKSKWMFGDWESLCSIDINECSGNPDRDKIALLIAAGHQQLGNFVESRSYVKLAKSWGVPDKTVAKVLIAGVDNSLGKIKALVGKKDKALHYFRESLSLLGENSEKENIRDGRAIKEMVKMGLLPQAADIVSKSINNENFNEKRPTDNAAKLEMLKTEIELINHNISLSYQKNQLYSSQIEGSNTESFKDRLKRLSPSQLGQDIWVLEQTSFKRGGYFVEFGATDGVMLSNTFLLEKEFGWTGICAEPNPKFYDLLKVNRECHVSTACVSKNDDETVKFIFAEEYGGIDEYTRKGSHSEKVDAYFKDSGSVSLKTTSLDSLLKMHNAPYDIDYISIDTEGNEYSILSTFPFADWNVMHFTIEHNFESSRDNIYQLMKRHGYERIERQWDDWYVKIK